jgi:hypothetical protein
MVSGIDPVVDENLEVDYDTISRRINYFNMNEYSVVCSIDKWP